MAKGATSNLNQLIQLRHQASELSLLANKKARSQLTGNITTQFRGRGLDFEELRQYQAGDDIRSIDWRVTARTGKAHTKLYSEERERPVIIVNDQRQAMAFGSRHCFKSVQATAIAALLSWSALAQNDRIGGLIFNDSDHTEIKPKRHKSSVLSILRASHEYNHKAVEFKQTDQPKKINTVLKELRQTVKPGSNVFIISDFIGLNETGVKHLYSLKKHVDITAIKISDPLEETLPSHAGTQYTNGEKEIVFDPSHQHLAKQFRQQFLSHNDFITSNLQKLGIIQINIKTNDCEFDILRQFFSRQACKRPLLLIDDQPVFESIK